MTLYIRASSLSNYADCPRRTAAKTLKEELEEAGYKLNTTPNSIGAIVGTAMHAGIAHSLSEKIKTGILGTIKDAEEMSLSNLSEGLTKDDAEVLLDSITKDVNEAQKQTLGVLRSAHQYILPTIEPKEVERRLEANLSATTILTGQIDVIIPNGIIDWKSGTRRRPNGPQYGAYLLLSRTHGIEVEDAMEYYIPRVKSDKTSKEPELHKYTGSIVENQAIAIATRFEKDVLEFRETKSRFAFMANPNSMLCSPKYCSAFGTNFCKEHQNG